MVAQRSKRFSPATTASSTTGAWTTGKGATRLLELPAATEGGRHTSGFGGAGLAFFLGLALALGGGSSFGSTGLFRIGLDWQGPAWDLEEGIAGGLPAALPVSTKIARLS